MTLPLLVTSAVGAWGAPEVCNAVDDDGDGQVDEAPLVWFADDDGDDAGDPATLVVTPTCFAPAGFTVDARDCDDTDDAVGPAGTEVPNAVDDDCDGLVDDQNLPASCTVDRDADSTFLFCDRPRLWDQAADDCATFDYHLLTIDDPAENAVLVPSLAGVAFWWMGWHDPPGAGTWQWADGTAVWGDNWEPGEPSIPNSDDCGLIGEGGTWFNWSCLAPEPFVCEADCVPRETWADSDGDGFGDPASGTESCGLPVGRVYNDADCDDTLAAQTVGLWYGDADNDGYGDSRVFEGGCTAPNGYVSDGTDCDDEDPTLNPGTEWYADDDGDGFGGAVVATGCTSPVPALRSSTDCDDTDPTIHPDGTEICGAADEDCDGSIDDDDPSLDPSSTRGWFPDNDHDGFGVPPEVRACAAPPDHADRAGDCDDGDPLASPEAFEQCDGEDNDCDDTIDEDVEDREWFLDRDGDGYGAPGTGVVDCLAPEGSVPDGTDCDDGDPAVNPGAAEIPDDGIDQDCDGSGGDRADRAAGNDRGGAADPGCACGTSSGSPFGLVFGMILATRRRIRRVG